MRFNKHFDLVGRHAFLSASKYHWRRYDDDKFDDVYRRAIAAQRGTDLHNLASEAIRLGVKLPRTKGTLNSYVNDAIGYRMTPEQVLYYSDNAFGTADAIGFRDGMLRIHDLKTGITPTKVDQLEIYVAFFCLEYEVLPTEIQMELRIYQNDEIAIFEPDPMEITSLMDRVVQFDKRIKAIQQEVFA